MANKRDGLQTAKTDDKPTRHGLRRRGATLTGYGLVVGLISLVALGALTSSGSTVKSLFESVGTDLAGGVGCVANSAPAEGGGTLDHPSLSHRGTFSSSRIMTAGELSAFEGALDGSVSTTITCFDGTATAATEQTVSACQSPGYSGPVNNACVTNQAPILASPACSVEIGLIGVGEQVTGIDVTACFEDPEGSTLSLASLAPSTGAMSVSGSSLTDIAVTGVSSGAGGFAVTAQDEPGLESPVLTISGTVSPPVQRCTEIAVISGNNQPSASSVAFEPDGTLDSCRALAEANSNAEYFSYSAYGNNYALCSVTTSSPLPAAGANANGCGTGTCWRDTLVHQCSYDAVPGPQPGDGQVFSSCMDAKTQGATVDGEYEIDPDGSGGIAQFTAICDMTTENGGWTLVATNNAGTDKASLATTGSFGSISQTSTFKLDDATMTALRSSTYDVLMKAGSTHGHMVWRRQTHGNLGYRNTTTGLTNNYFASRNLTPRPSFPPAQPLPSDSYTSTKACIIWGNYFGDSTQEFGTCFASCSGSTSGCAGGGMPTVSDALNSTGSNGAVHNGTATLWVR